MIENLLGIPGQIFELSTTIDDITTTIAADVAPSATALDNTVWTDDKANKIDDAISTRAAAATALDNTIWTDTRADAIDNLDVVLSSRASSGDMDAARITLDQIANGTFNILNTTNSIEQDIDNLIPALANVAVNLAQIKSQTDNIPTLAKASTALSNVTWTNTIAGRINTSISSRADQTTVNAIKAKTDLIGNTGAVRAIHRGSSTIEKSTSVSHGTDSYSPGSGYVKIGRDTDCDAAYPNAWAYNYSESGPIAHETNAYGYAIVQNIPVSVTDYTKCSIKVTGSYYTSVDCVIHRYNYFLGNFSGSTGSRTYPNIGRYNSYMASNTVLKVKLPTVVDSATYASGMNGFKYAFRDFHQLIEYEITEYY